MGADETPGQRPPRVSTALGYVGSFDGLVMFFFFFCSGGGGGGGVEASVGVGVVGVGGVGVGVGGVGGVGVVTGVIFPSVLFFIFRRRTPPHLLNDGRFSLLLQTTPVVFGRRFLPKRAMLLLLLLLLQTVASYGCRVPLFHPAAGCRGCILTCCTSRSVIASAS